MALEAIINDNNVYRVVLEEYPEGVYVLIYDSADVGSESPCEDHLQDNWEIAKLSAQRRFNISDDQWREIPDTCFNGKWK